MCPSTVIVVVQVWRDLALAYASQQQPSDAEKCVQHMRVLDPDSAASYHAMGAVAASCRNDVAAKAAYKAALALDAAYAPALLSLGESCAGCCVSPGRHGERRSVVAGCCCCARCVLCSFIMQVPCCGGRAAVHDMSGCYRRPLLMRVAAVCACPVCVSVLQHPGALLRRQGDVHDLSVADGLLTAALRYEPDNHVGWYHLGLARKAQGHIGDGEKHLFNAMELASAAPVVSCSKLPLLL